MATEQSSTPSFFNFLKEGLLLPSHNRRLFAAVFAVIATATCLLLLGHDLAVQPLILQPLRDKLDLNTKALNSTDPSNPGILQLIQKNLDDTRTWALLLTSLADHVFTVIIKSAIQIVVLFAAVATYSGELHTFGSLLGKVKKQLRGPVLTLAFVYALKIARYVVTLLIVMCTLVMVLAIMKYLWLFCVVWLLLLVPFIVFIVYFFFVCSMSVVVAVAEPGCHGPGALGRAWRLVKGKSRRAMLFIAVTIVLELLKTALNPVYNLAKTCALSNMASGLLLGFLYIILIAVLQLFEACATTAFYYECRGATRRRRWGTYVKVSTKEQIDV